MLDRVDVLLAEAAPARVHRRSIAAAWACLAGVIATVVTVSGGPDDRGLGGVAPTTGVPLSTTTAGPATSSPTMSLAADPGTKLRAWGTDPVFSEERDVDGKRVRDLTWNFTGTESTAVRLVDPPPVDFPEMATLTGRIVLTGTCDEVVVSIAPPRAPRHRTTGNPRSHCGHGSWAACTPGSSSRARCTRRSHSPRNTRRATRG
ncbi:hypothetical protein V5P93_003749 [Actinokineospora auranticolor]|uniref:hypothetical protein n=1 Tax=Actinokineospora auranticolor TaxID=155976 RepID=UPI0035A88181